MAESIDLLMQRLDEPTITREVTRHHDEEFLRHGLTGITVGDFREFEHKIAEFWQRYFSNCLMPGGRFAGHSARSRAKRTLEARLRRGEGDIQTYYQRCEEGAEGGMKNVIETISEMLKNEELSDYVRDCIDSCIPRDFDSKVDAVRGLFKRYRSDFSSTVDLDNPARYAHEIGDLVTEVSQAIQRALARARRL